MSKKYLLVLALAAGIATGAFAQSLFSVGGGLIFETGSLGSGEGSVWIPSGSWPWGTVSLSQTGFGAWAFADATFAELSVAVMRGSHNIRYPSGSANSGSVTILDLTLLGKLPIFLGWGDVFPLLGVGYQHYITRERWLFVRRDFGVSIMFGAGGDIDLTRQMFVRASILGSYRFATWSHGDGRDALQGDTGGFGATVKAGIGFRL